MANISVLRKQCLALDDENYRNVHRRTIFDRSHSIGDYKAITKGRYFFNWKSEKGKEVFKLRIIETNEFLGLISIERIPEEWRIHIRLLTVSIENMGKHKKYERIVGNLLTHVAKIAVLEFGELACISLRPKSSIARHYVERYCMNITGMTLSMEVEEILNLINEYDND